MISNPLPLWKITCGGTLNHGCGSDLRLSTQLIYLVSPVCEVLEMIIHTNCSISDNFMETLMRLFLILDLVNDITVPILPPVVEWWSQMRKQLSLSELYCGYNITLSDSYRLYCLHYRVWDAMNSWSPMPWNTLRGIWVWLRNFWHRVLSCIFMLWLRGVTTSSFLTKWVSAKAQITWVLPLVEGPPS